MTSIFLQANSPAGGGMMTILMFVAIFVIMYFFMIRPQQKQRKEIQKFQNSLEEGKKVIIGGGIYGEVKSVNLTAHTVDVKIASNVVITVDISNVFATPNQQEALKK